MVDEATRDQWILDTARRTRDRLKAVNAVRADPKATAEQLIEKGHPKAVAEGALLAQQSYGLTDVSRYGVMLRTSLGHLLPGASVPVHRVEQRETEQHITPGTPTTATPSDPSAWKAPATPAKPEVDEAKDALDNQVLAAVAKLEGQKGARWDDILGQVAVGGITSEDVEESLNRLMDKGLIYEPTLGILRTT